MPIDRQEYATGYYVSPLGLLAIGSTERGIASIAFVERETTPHTPRFFIAQCIEELDAYFENKRSVFTVPCVTEGTAFQTQVWQALTLIPFGTTLSYADIARKIARPKAVRAVGTANGANPIPIIIPCHRVLRHNHGLGGYASGPWRKQWLLRHEGI